MEPNGVLPICVSTSDVHLDKDNGCSRHGAVATIHLGWLQPAELCSGAKPVGQQVAESFGELVAAVDRERLAATQEKVSRFRRDTVPGLLTGLCIRERTALTSLKQ